MTKPYSWVLSAVLAVGLAAVCEAQQNAPSIEAQPAPGTAGQPALPAPGAAPAAQPATEAPQDPVPGNAAPAANPPGSPSPPGDDLPDDLPTESVDDVPGAAATPEPVVPPDAAQIIKETFDGGAVKVEKQVVKGDDGKLVNFGSFTQYYESGKKHAFGDFLNGKRHGKWSKWFGVGESELYASPIFGGYPGPFFTEAVFNNGVLHGPWTVYDARKNKMSEWHFVDGVQHGPWTWYYPNGKPHRESQYVNGVLDGQVLLYDESGKVYSTENYVGGRKLYQKQWRNPYGGVYVTGAMLEGVVKTKTTYDWWNGQGESVVLGKAGKDVKHGQWTWFHPSGKKSIIGEYHLDKPIGEWTWLTEVGNVEKTRNFVVAGVSPPAGAAGAPGAAGAAGAGPPQNAAPGNPGAAGGAPPKNALPKNAPPGNPAADAAPPKNAPPGTAPGAGAPPANSPPANAPPAAAPPAGAPPQNAPPGSAPTVDAPKSAPDEPRTAPPSPAAADSPAAASAVPAELVPILGLWETETTGADGATKKFQLNLAKDGSATISVDGKAVGSGESKQTFEVADGNFNLVNGDKKTTLGKVVSADKDKVVLNRNGKAITFVRP